MLRSTGIESSVWLVMQMSTKHFIVSVGFKYPVMHIKHSFQDEPTSFTAAYKCKYS